VSPADCPPGLRAVVLGGASCVWEDLRALEALAGPWSGLVAAVNDTGAHWAGRLDIWASLHPWRFVRELDGVGPWLDQRRLAGHPDACRVVGDRQGMPRPILPHAARWHSGTSTLFAVDYLLRSMGVRRVVLCGAPMDPRPNQWRGKGWEHSETHRPAWRRVQNELDDRVRSMSGWTRRLLGAPEARWLNIDQGDAVK
jgi:hypothetical protein